MASPATSWPRTVDEAVEQLLGRLGPSWTETLRATTRDRARAMNLSLGMWIRNEFGMWRGNRELLEDCVRFAEAPTPTTGSATGGTTPQRIDPDLASSLIIGLVWDRLRDSAEDEPSQG